MDVYVSQIHDLKKYDPEVSCHQKEPFRPLYVIAPDKVDECEGE